MLEYDVWGASHNDNWFVVKVFVLRHLNVNEIERLAGPDHSRGVRGGFPVAWLVTDTGLVSR
jgi:hypothetical protein